MNWVQTIETLMRGAACIAPNKGIISWKVKVAALNKADRHGLRTKLINGLETSLLATLRELALRTYGKRGQDAKNV